MVCLNNYFHLFISNFVLFKEKNKKSPHHKDTFFERLQFHILRNLEIEIKNIHIAYDDNTTKSYPFQFGITLNYIKLNVRILVLK
jgi:hypothetical protein